MVMEEYRLIIISNEDGSDERVIFTDDDDYDTPADDFCVAGVHTVDFDKIIEAELPSMFPINSELRRT